MKWYRMAAKTFVDLGGVRRFGQVIRLNRKTVWVKIMIGARSSITIKRHRAKHHMLGYVRTNTAGGNVYSEIIHT
jgi:hypothetical protein